MSFAQNDTTPPVAAQDSERIFKDVPDEYLDEAAAHYERCERDYILKQYYNCECRATAYLEERIKQGPSATAGNIGHSLKNKCRDAVGAAGTIYKNCLARSHRFEQGVNPETYCECIANNYVRIANELKPRINTSSLIQLENRAYRYCNR